jgi:hypothetical protein
MAEPGVDRQPVTPRKPNRLWRWTKRDFIGLAGSILILLLAGVIYQLYISWARRISRRGGLQSAPLLQGRREHQAS